MLFLDALYRDGAGKAGITYVDVWDGFVDEAGRFLQKGPDFEGQIRQLRTDDGVFFTKPGARKLAHYVEREIDAPAGCPLRPDRAADRAGDTRRQCRARPAGAASAGRTDHAAGGLFRRHRSVARRSRLAPRRGRCARRAHAGEGRGAGATGRPRRRFRLAAPRSRPRAGQGRYAGGQPPRRAERWRQCPDRSSFCCRRRSNVTAATEAAARRRCRSDPRRNNGPSLRDFFGGFGTTPRQPAPPPPPHRVDRNPGRTAPAG